MKITSEDIARFKRYVRQAAHAMKAIKKRENQFKAYLRGIK